MPLKFELGEAFQFDWSEEWLVIGGILRKILAAHTKLCANRAFMLSGYPSQNHMVTAQRNRYSVPCHLTNQKVMVHLLFKPSRDIFWKQDCSRHTRLLDRDQISYD